VFSLPTPERATGYSNITPEESYLLLQRSNITPDERATYTSKGATSLHPRGAISLPTPKGATSLPPERSYITPDSPKRAISLPTPLKEQHHSRLPRATPESNYPLERSYITPESNYPLERSYITPESN
jgi:hypothetical protein